VWSEALGPCRAARARSTRCSAAMVAKYAGIAVTVGSIGGPTLVVTTERLR
jgi:hypothetical protein